MIAETPKRYSAVEGLPYFPARLPLLAPVVDGLQPGLRTSGRTEGHDGGSGGANERGGRAAAGPGSRSVAPSMTARRDAIGERDVTSRSDDQLLWVFGSVPTMKLTLGNPANAAVWNTLFTTTACTS